MQILRKLPGGPRLGAPLAREGWRVRTRHVPLAREQRNRRSENIMFYPPLFGRIAPFTGPSALQAPILDRGADSGGGAGYHPWHAKVHGDLRDFCDCVPYFLASVANSDGKTPNGQRGHAKGQRESWCF